MTLMVEPLRLSLQAHLRSLAPMRRSVRAWLTEVGASDIADVVLAVDEAVANSIEHASLTATAVITVEGQVVDGDLRIEICDPGAWKEHTDDDARGQGLRIMKAVMGSVSIEHRDNETLVVLSRLLR